MPETVPDASYAPPDGRFFHPDPVENARKDVFSVPDSTKSQISRFILSSSGLRRPETGFPKPAASTGCLWKPARSLPRGIERPDRTSACGCLWRISGKNARFSHAFPYPFPEMFSTPPPFSRPAHGRLSRRKILYRDGVRQRASCGPFGKLFQPAVKVPYFSEERTAPASPSAVFIFSYLFSLYARGRARTADGNCGCRGRRKPEMMSERGNGRTAGVKRYYFTI